MGGVLVINTVSLSLGVMGNLVSDLDQRKLDAYLVTPVKRYKIILSYYISSILVTATLTLLMWVLTILYVGVFADYWYSFSTILITTGLIIFYTFISATLMIFLKSVNAFGALSGVLGTLIGFMSGIYMPLFVLGDAMSKVASLVPFTHMTILLKQVILKDAYAQVGPDIAEGVSLFYGTQEIGILGQPIEMFWIMIMSFALGMLLLYFSYRKMNRKLGKS
jgi:multidrug/hemolysin transport system permease protein